MILARVINIDAITAYYRPYSTKAFFSSKYNNYFFSEDEHWEYAELVENIKDGKVAVFSISTDVRMEEVINTSKLGLKVYIVRFRDYKELKKHYIAAAVEGLTDTEQQ